MVFFRRKRKTALYEILCREYGVPCPFWTSMQAFRYTAFGPRRRWVKILQMKPCSSLELKDDLWLRVIAQRNGSSHYVMTRILGDGQLKTLHSSSLIPHFKETDIYEIPDPIYQTSIPPKEYQPVLVGLRKGSLLTRQNLITGEVYNKICLGRVPTKSMDINFYADILVVKSQRYSHNSTLKHLFRFHIFQMHPFKHLTTFDIDSEVFPNKEKRKKFGKLRSVEIIDGLLTVMTEKNFTLLYDAEKIIEGFVAKRKKNEGSELHPASVVSEEPPLLFSTYAHWDALDFGACPWSYIHAVSEGVWEVRDLGTGQLLGNGSVHWNDDIIQDHLIFHPDDSSRVIHVRTEELRFLSIRTREGKRVLEEEFVYPDDDNDDKTTISNAAEEVRYSRSGRRTKSLFKLDPSLNRVVCFNVETDMRVLVILEAWKDENLPTIRLEKLTFYDSLSYELLHRMNIGIDVQVDVTNSISVRIDRDTVNIVSRKYSMSTILSFRLKEDFTRNEEEEDDKKENETKSSKRIINNSRTKKRSQTHNSDSEWEDDELQGRKASKR